MNDKRIQQVGFSGGCYWCIEAVFQSLIGVRSVRQGWIKPINGLSYTEGVFIDFDPDDISLEVLIAVHLHTHDCTTSHALRYRYPSGVYILNEAQRTAAMRAMALNQADFTKPLLTRVYDFGDFKLSKESQWDYYYSDPQKPFCLSKINPKLQLLLARFSDHISDEKQAIIRGV
ncbi:peptide-methionine (S)-S-oxide reductase [Photobacterium minamisatsumaniensis]|uniref:peptide-methionine (S)-S-oxide reductase n=1 Tax=Photobacterium minamisatsumaniensis TaxID=2910233 RepID=UPI003D0F00D9